MLTATSAEFRRSVQTREANLLRLAFVFVVVNVGALGIGLYASQGQSWVRSLAPVVVLPVWATCAWLLHRRLNRSRPGRDPLLLPIILLLSGWGVVLNWRLALEYGSRQTAWFLVSVALLLIIAESPGDLLWLRRFRILWLALGLALTGATLLFGTNPSGGEARLWLGCCGMYIQPSEPLRLLLLAYLASYLAERVSARRKASSLMPVVAPLVIVWVAAVGLLAAQRDLGAGSLFLALLVILLYVVFERWQLFAVGIGLIVAVGLAGRMVTPVVEERLSAWLNPFADPTGSSYQVLQSVIALAHGGLFGAGPGQGAPVFIPAVHTDFIFSALVEEWGLAGGVAVLALYAILLSRAFRAAQGGRDVYSALLAAGVSVAIGLQALIILGGNLVILPLTGVTLPFLSYGGSSLTTSFLAAGLLILVSDHRSSRPPLGRSIERVQAGMLLGWGLMALVLGWWVLVRGPAMLERPENPRSAAGYHVLAASDP